MIDNSGAEQLPLATLADTGQLADLTPLFDAESIDGGKIRDTLNPVAVEAGDYGGKILVLNYALEVYGLWYDKTLFDKKGWQPAETWEDFLALAEEIKGAGIAPMAHQGKYPYYIQQVTMDMAVKHGGEEVVTAIDSLEPNAWKHPSVKMAAEALLEIKSKGYMLQGTEGLDHIQSQTRWNEGKAAFIPSGSWLENEQKKVAPEDFETTVAPTPLMDGSKLPFQSTRVSAAEAFIVPAKAKNVPGGQEYLRIMLSKEGRRSSPSSPPPRPWSPAPARASTSPRPRPPPASWSRPAATTTGTTTTSSGTRRCGPRSRRRSGSWPPAASRPTSSRRLPEGGRRDRQGPADQEADPQLAASLPPELDATRSVTGSSRGSWSFPWRCTRSS